MKLYIWEGDEISDGYHDDGTLVVLAETPRQAREIAIASIPKVDSDRTAVWTDGGAESCREAIKRRPDRVVDLDAPRVVAFNGGGYD